MITEETVFILGAGASWPYGYPTGAGLKDIICDDLDQLLDPLTPRSEYYHSSYEIDQKETIEEDSVKFKNIFCNNPVGLIDNFIARREEFHRIGKILISLCILNAEKNSRFYRDIEKSERQFDWYSSMFNILVAEIKDQERYIDIKKNRVNFITFNYDRSLEYFLWDKFRDLYEPSINFIKDKPVDLIPNIIHVYGKIDNFDYEDPPGKEYKGKYHLRDILRVAGNIKLIHERDDEFFDDIKQTIAKAKNIFFLGFGYDEDNMRALGWPENFNEGKNIFGTARNMTERRISDLKSMIRKGFKNPSSHRRKPFIEPLDSNALLEKYSNFLS